MSIPSHMMILNNKREISMKSKSRNWASRDKNNNKYSQRKVIHSLFEKRSVDEGSKSQNKIWGLQ